MATNIKSCRNNKTKKILKIKISKDLLSPKFSSTSKQTDRINQPPFPSKSSENIFLLISRGTELINSPKFVPQWKRSLTTKPLGNLEISIKSLH